MRLAKRALPCSWSTATRFADGPRLAAAASRSLLDGAIEVTPERALDGEARAQAVNRAEGDENGGSRTVPLGPGA
jgi:hypothetical protein